MLLFKTYIIEFPVILDHMVYTGGDTVDHLYDS